MLPSSTLKFLQGVDLGSSIVQSKGSANVGKRMEGSPPQGSGLPMCENEADRLVTLLLAGPGIRQESECSKWLPKRWESPASPEDAQTDLLEWQWPPVEGSLPVACGEMNPAAAFCVLFGEQPGLLFTRKVCCH